MAMNVRYCTDCKHFRSSWFLRNRLGTCESPQNVTISLVDRSKSYKYSRFADVQRSHGDVGDCSPSGKWFEGKDMRTMWARLVDA